MQTKKEKYVAEKLKLPVPSAAFIKLIKCNNLVLSLGILPSKRVASGAVKKTFILFLYQQML